MIKQLLIISLVLSAIVAEAQYRFVRQNVTATVYDDINVVFDSAAVGDTIYLPNGAFSKPLIVDKEIHIIGVGYDVENSDATVMTEIIKFETGSDNSTMQGVYCKAQVSVNYTSSSSSVDTVRNLLFNRCLFASGLKLGTSYGHSSNIYIKENVLWGIVDFTKCHNSLIENNIFMKTSSYNVSYAEQLRFENNIFFNTESFGALYYSNSNNLVNNILVGKAIYAGSANNVISNNLIASASVSGFDVSIMANNKVVAFDALIFENVPDYTAWSSADDYKLIGGSSAIGVGKNGIDAGIYAGGSPWKANGQPDNPQILNGTVNRTTTTGGKLQVTFDVEAQGN